MKELKFRVWDKKLMHTVSSLIWCLGGTKWGGHEPIQGWCYLDPNFDWSYDIDRNDKPNTVDILMQWTGLKDCNETDIYEGDIVAVIMGCIVRNTFILEIKWDGNQEHVGFGLYEKQKYWDRLNSKYAKEYEIIGNIYENPDLM